MNWQIGLGLVLEGLSTLGLFGRHDRTLLPAFAVVYAVLLAIACGGAGLILAGVRVTGAGLVIAGSFLFIPLGLLMIFGARRVLDLECEASFSKGGSM